MGGKPQWNRYPGDCSKYVVCNNNRLPIIKSCPGGLVWDESIGVCNFKSRVNCDDGSGKYLFNTR